VFFATIIQYECQSKNWERIIIYNRTNDIAALRKHVNSYHYNILNFFEEEINCPLKEDEKQPSKKRPGVSSNSISSFLATKEHFKKDDV
jgi:hypothetical protein